MFVFPRNTAQIARRAGFVVPLAVAGMMPFLMPSNALASCTGSRNSCIDCTGTFSPNVPTQFAAPPDETTPTTA
jgi:hypothetical protein